ncbi:unnamed protein product [Phytophthora fragariaefolia]|uniref:Unnamed protein product n=1 Tax=Phytophthora fragariaefolia TaxID=1490495 RepID=A0A9W6XGC3_9STRA|nr:unnamed protein product [Phytophthora fragariaefolia]
MEYGNVVLHSCQQNHIAVTPVVSIVQSMQTTVDDLARGDVSMSATSIWSQINEQFYSDNEQQALVGLSREQVLSRLYPLIDALGDRFPKADIIGCLFHFKQAIPRKMKSIEISNRAASIAMEPSVLDMLTVVPIEKIESGGITWVKRQIKERCLAVELPNEAEGSSNEDDDSEEEGSDSVLERNSGSGVSAIADNDDIGTTTSGVV